MKKTVIFLGFIATFLSSFTQMYEVSLDAKIENSPLIVEASVIAQKSFWDKSRSMIYTSNILTVHKKIKGKIQGGEIEVITKGGHIGSDAVRVSHNLELNIGDVGLFFCMNTNRPSGNDVNRYATYQIYAESQGFVKYYENNRETEAAEPFHGYKNREIDLLSVVERISGSEREFISYNPIEFRTLSSHGISINQTTTTVIYEFDNPVVNTNLMTFEFDVNIANALGQATLGESEIYIDYNLACFGPNVVLNNKIVVTKETAIISPDYGLVISDSTGNKLKMKISALGTNNLFTLTPTREKILHVVLDISTIAGSPDIFFDMPSMAQLSTYFVASNATFVPFQLVIAQDSLSLNFNNMGGPQILNFAPAVITAGTQSVLHITGNGFGVQGANGRVIFQDADVNAGITQAVVGDDYVTWTDTEIEVKVPSQGSNPLQTHPAGTGLISVVTDGGNIAVSNTPLTIEYAIENRRSSAFLPNKAYEGLIADGNVNDNVDGIVFTFNDNFALNLPAVARFTESVSAWRCATLVNFDLSNNVTVLNAEAVDAVNVVSFGVVAVGNNAETTTHLTACIDDDIYYYTSEIDIIFGANPSPQNLLTWFYDVPNLPSNNEIDFYTTCLHEVGHGHLILHEINAGHLMHATTVAGAASAMRQLEPNHIAAGTRVVGNSIVSHQVIQGNNCPEPMIAIDPLLCNIANAISSGNLANPIIIYPNPAQSEYIYINVSEWTKVDLELEIQDCVGKKTISTQLDVSKVENGIAKINIKDFAKGLYFLTLRGKNQSFNTYKLIIQ